jgi:hypothetical protein
MKLITSALLLILFAQTDASSQAPQTVSVQGQIYATNFGALLTDIELRLLRDGRVIRLVRSDKAGSYFINDISAGGYDISIEERGFVTKRLHLELAAGEQRVLDIDVQVGHLENYSTPQEFNIRGTVTQSNGKPIPRASVVLVCPFNGNQVSEAKTDEKGQYKLSDGGPGLGLCFQTGFYRTMRIYLASSRINARATNDQLCTRGVQANLTLL